MSEWIIAHPWMTFILCLAAIEGLSNSIVAVCTAIAACREDRANKEDVHDQPAD